MLRKFACGLLASLGIAQLAFAAGIAVSPLLLEVVLPPGTSYQDAIYVTNTGDEPIVVEAKVVGFMAPEGLPIFLEPELDTYPYSGRELLTLEPQDVTVQPGESVAFQFRVEMPEDLEPYGGRYVAAVFRAKPPEAAGAQVIVAAEVASLFLLNPGVEVLPRVEVSHLRVVPSPTAPGEWVIEALMANSGNIHISYQQLVGHIYITDLDGYLVGEVEMHLHTMLPGTSHFHREVWRPAGELSPGTYRVYLDILALTPLGTEPQRCFHFVEVELGQ
jgi:hypothetical protein